MAALLGQIILQAAERALVYVGTALAGLVIGEKIVDAAKESEDEFESKDTTACLVCGPSNTANTNPDEVSTSDSETINNGPAGATVHGQSVHTNKPRQINVMQSILDKPFNSMYNLS